MLFAADDAVQAGTWVAAIIAVSGALVAWFKDKGQYETRIVKLEADVASCHENRDKEKQELLDLKAKDARQQVEIDDLRRQLPESLKDCTALHEDIKKLKASMVASGLRSDSTQVKVPDSSHD